MKHPRIAIVVALMLTVSPAVARAQGTAPPGNSAVDQYRESAPPTASGSKKLDAARRKSLGRQGSDGAALAAAIDRNGGIPSNGSVSTESDASTGGTAPGPRSSEATSERDSAADNGVGADAAEAGASDSGAGGVSVSGTDDRREDDQTVTEAAADSTVGPMPVWGMVVAAMVVVAVGLVLRRRAST